MGATSTKPPKAVLDSRTERVVKTAGFDPQARRDVAELAARDPRLADLATTFPGLLYALATGYGTPQQRAAALDKVLCGARLRTAAAEIGLPLWLRHVPATAFTFPLHRFPDGRTAARRLVSLLPPAPVSARSWLWAVHYATSACDEEFGVWIAEQANRHPGRFRGATGRMTLRHLTAWAWFSKTPGHQGHAFINRPWTADMGLRRAIEELGRWRGRIDLARALTQRPASARWIDEGDSNGFSFIELTGVQDFIDESVAMDNCLDQFANQLTVRDSQIFSIRQNGRPLANVEIGRHDSEATMPAILQLRGPRNRRAASRIWQAAYAWLGAQKIAPRRMTLKRTVAKRAIQAFELAFWSPYTAALNEAHLPEKMRDEILLTFDLPKAALAPARRRARSSGRTDTGNSAKAGETTPTASDTPKAAARPKVRKRAGQTQPGQPQTGQTQTGQTQTGQPQTGQTQTGQPQKRMAVETAAPRKTPAAARTGNPSGATPTSSCLEAPRHPA